jgi:hypothetical protein
MKKLILLLIIFLKSCDDNEIQYADEYSNRDSIWEYCYYQADTYDTTLVYVRTVEMDKDSTLVRTVNCPKIGTIITTTKWIKK